MLYLKAYNNKIYFLMTQLTLTISDPKDASLIKRFLSKFDTVTISKPSKKRKTGLDEAIEDVKAGRVYHAESVDDLFDQLNS